MKKGQRSILVLLAIFVVLLSTTLFVSFSSNLDVQEVVVKSITPVYDENSTVVVDNTNVVFNDKNQTVEYKVVIENTLDRPIQIDDVTLTRPSEKFLEYSINDLLGAEVIKPNSTKEFTLSLETTGIKGWGRNFNDELTANISFEKLSNTVKPPVKHPTSSDDTTDKEDEVETPEEEVKAPETPVANTEELIDKVEKIEILRVTKDTIEFKETPKLEKGDKIAVWLYSEPIFLGYFEVVENDGIKQIVGLEKALKEANVKEGEHNIVLVSPENETIGYVEVYVSENKNLSSELIKEDDGKVENPYTSDKGLIVILCMSTIITGVSIIILSKNKLAKYTVFILILTPALTVPKAEEVIELSIKNNVSFESQNVMTNAYELKYSEGMGDYYESFLHFWVYREGITNIYIENEFSEIQEYAFKFDVSENQNSRVIAYLVANEEIPSHYDLYLQADGIIYPNEDASYYFASMSNLKKIDNINGFDTSDVTDMSYMFSGTGSNSENFTLDVSSFDTSNVTDMSWMFSRTGYDSDSFVLNLSNFDTSNVIDMSHMFNSTGYNSIELTLDVSNFDTSSVTDMHNMFSLIGFNSIELTFDVSNFDTSKVTDMSYMFYRTGYSSTNFTLDVSNFDTSNVTNMYSMFNETCYNSPNFILDVSNFDTSKVTDMGQMFRQTGYSSTVLELDVSNFNTSKVTNMSSMFENTGYNSENFTLDVSNFDTSNVIDMIHMFRGTGHNSARFNTSITIQNPDIEEYWYDNMFLDVATKEGSQIKVNYTSETEELVDKMIATKTKGANVVKGNLIVDVDKLTIGDEIHISGEKFNVISQTPDTVILFAKLNLGPEYKQNAEQHAIVFAETNGWEYTTGPKEIDVQTWTKDPKVYINRYVEFLQEELGDNTITGNLITLKELESLGCIIPSDYSYSDEGELFPCVDSPHKSWIVNGQTWWTRSVLSNSPDFIWFINFSGELYITEYYIYDNSLHPTITIPKETLRNIS